MHWLEIKVRNQVVEKDNDFLVKAPLMPNKYLYRQREYILAVYKSETEDRTYYLQTDNDNFYDSYKKYYDHRFDTQEQESGFSLPSGFELLMGSADSAPTADSSDYEETSSENGEEISEADKTQATEAEATTEDRKKESSTSGKK